jgi:hypothetical protein
MSKFNQIAKGVELRARVASDKDSEWQRVNSYVADILKDSHVLYAKLARLQGDFGGKELQLVEKISEEVLELGRKLSSFSKAFYQGKASMVSHDVYGDVSFGGFAGDVDFDADGGGAPSPGGAPDDFGGAGGDDFGSEQGFGDMEVGDMEAGEFSDEETGKGGGEKSDVEMTFDYEEEEEKPKKPGSGGGPIKPKT